MDLESTRLFNDRLAQWVAKQGFWFQIRYSMAGGGASVMMYHLMRILMRIGIFVLIVAAVIFYMLFKRADKPAFKMDLQQSIISGLECKSGKMYGFNRSQNKATIRYMTLEGGPKSFMHSCEASGISFRMGMLDGITTSWDVNRIAVDRMSINVKAGAETAEEALDLGRSFTKEFENVHFQTFECNNTRISWGYSARTMGSISDSHMTMIRDGNGWRLRFTGGYFSQNWLRDLQIDELVLNCNDEGVTVEKGEFTILRPLPELSESKKHGKISFRNVQVHGGLRPEYSGDITLESVLLEKLLPDAYRGYVEGSISGQLKIQGSTNSPDGVSLSGRISLNENDQIDVRNRIHIFNRLSLLSPSGSYRKTTFKEGFFNIKTTAGSLQVSDINLSAPNQMDLRGEFLVRPPKQQEIEDMFRKGTISNDAAQEIAQPGMSVAALLASQELTLRQAVKIANKDGKAATAGFDDTSIDVGVPFQADAIQTDLQQKTTELLATTSIYEGQVLMTLPVALFEENSDKMIRLPLSANGQFYLLQCPLLGNLSDLTLVQSEELQRVKKAADDEPEKVPTNP